MASGCAKMVERIYNRLCSGSVRYDWCHVNGADDSEEMALAGDSRPTSFFGDTSRRTSGTAALQADMFRSKIPDAAHRELTVILLGHTVVWWLICQAAR